MKCLLGIILLVCCSCNNNSNSKSNTVNANNSDSDSSFIRKDSLKKVFLDHSQEITIMDTIFSNNSSLIISSYWIQGEYSQFMDSIIVKVINRSDTCLLIYDGVAIADAVVKKLEIKKDKRENIYCFIKFYGVATPGSEAMIAYRQDGDKCRQITFDGDNCIRYGPDCGLDSVDVTGFTMICSAFPRLGRKNDETKLYVKNSDTSFVLSKIKN